MEPACRFPGETLDVREERDDVVTSDLLDFIDGIGVDIVAERAHSIGCPGGHQTRGFHRPARCDFDFEPGRVPALRGPESLEFSGRIAWNHGRGGDLADRSAAREPT